MLGWIYSVSDTIMPMLGWAFFPFCPNIQHFWLMDIQISIFINNQLRATRMVATPCVIGRSRQATLTIGHPVVSRRHCELYLENGTLNIRDAGSLNGTYFQGDILSGSAEIKPGDSFRIGELTFVVNFQASKDQNFGIVGATPRSVATMSVLESDSSSALAPPSSSEIIDLATLPGVVVPSISPTKTPPKVEPGKSQETAITTPYESGSPGAK